MKIKSIVAVCTMCAVLSGCADHVSFQEASQTVQVGFWHGLWHGMMLPISWIISLFSSDTAIYAIYNNGGWYDFGYFLGIGGLSGGASSRARKKRNR